MELGQAVNRYPVVRKLWPSCAYTHRTIHGAEMLHRGIGEGAEIRSIKVRMPEPFHRVAGFVVPNNDAEARFSVSYCAVVGLLTGHVAPDDFREHRFSDPVRRKMTAAVELDLYALPKGDSGDIGPSTPEVITVTLEDGRVLTRETLHVPGGVGSPMTRAQLLQKVADCRCSVAVAEAFLNADGATPVSETGILDQVQGV
ncbi:MmgE/PrpD family protein [Limibaculum sp. M0105]|uniref:MmgE/PrpD family protein n=1 Tax=Thermohalobaculum xanthum TaxID=2753746 RepID=A0A8J7SDT3_9RHOB|nr:MmgE/PrpD family protein [Thermohalobaculum xanthum]MBK0399031.1 MmgE/PrpD family protein [Thermohalobaculum xanthum]